MTLASGAPSRPSLKMLACEWAKRRADLYVVLGPGAAELCDELGPGAVVLAVAMSQSPGNVARAVYDVACAPGFLPRQIVTVMHPAQAQDKRVWPLAKAVAAGARRFLVSVNTFATFARAFVYHTLRNVEWYAGSLDYGALQNQCAGVPAVVVGAGPSLTESLPDLRNVTDRALIVTCDTAAPVLVAAGIEPDVIATIDLQPRKRRVLRFLRGQTRAVLAQLQYCHPLLSAAWTGSRMWLGAPSAASALLPSVMAVPETLSVAQAAFFVARHLGCSPIALCGVDLAFTGPANATHAAGAFGHWGELGGARADLFATGLDGATWPTLNTFQAMAASFEAAIAQTAGPVWNATARGLLIQGAERKHLRDLPAGVKPIWRGQPLQFAVADIHARLRSAAADPPPDLTRMCAFADWWRDREWRLAPLMDAQRFARKCCELALRRLPREVG